MGGTNRVCVRVGVGVGQLIYYIFFILKTTYTSHDSSLSITSVDFVCEKLILKF